MRSRIVNVREQLKCNGSGSGERTAREGDPGRMASETDTCDSPLDDVPLNLRVYICRDMVDQEREVVRCAS